MGGLVARMGEKKNAYRLFVGKPEVETTWKTKTLVVGYY
jgi:hypothetical protein